MKILIINGSHREGNTTILVNKLKEEIFNQKNDAVVNTLVLKDLNLQLPDGCEYCARAEICPNVHDNFSKTIEPTLIGYDIYIIATPTYDDGVTPLLKIFWDRIVSWSHDDRGYLKNKKLAVVAHGMAGYHSWEHIVAWVRSVCHWENSSFAGSLGLSSGAKVGTIEINGEALRNFVKDIL